jgi:hypothetical protein
LQTALTILTVSTFGLPSGPAVAAPALTVTAERTADTVFRWQTDRCSPNDIPDAPARAFRDSAGVVHLIAGHDVNRALIGPTLADAKIACDVLHEGRHADDPQQYDDRVWLAAFHTDDGRKIAALAHAEFHGHLRPALCPSGQYLSCWANAVVGLASDDGGRRFQRQPGAAALVAALPGPHAQDVGRQVGYFSPSNIVTVGDDKYVFIFAEPYGAQKRGACLLRTRSPADPGSWRAWDGKDFSVSLAADGVCAPVGALQSTVTGVVRHVPSGLFIAVFAATRADAPEARKVTGVYYATSRDLLRWSAPGLLLEMPILFAYACGAPAVYAYPSLIDHHAEARNFDTVSDRAYLYATRINMTGCKLPMDRDLVRFAVRIGAPGAP